MPNRIQIYKGAGTWLFVKHGSSAAELATAAVRREEAVVRQLNPISAASTAVVDCSVLGHARAATTHVATDWVDTASHRARDCQAWIVVGACSRGWAFDDAATTAAVACGAAAAVGAATAFAPTTFAAAVTSTGGGTSSAHSTCPLGPTSAIPTW